MEVDYHFIREKVLRKDLNVGFVLGKDDLADVFTKPLLAPQFLFFHSKFLVDSSPYRLRWDFEEVQSSSSSQPLFQQK